MAGRPVKLNGFVELGSLMLFAGWGLRTVNMPATQAIVCGSVLNKTVSCADENWGTRWDELAKSLRVYVLGGCQARLARLGDGPGLPVKF